MGHNKDRQQGFSGVRPTDYAAAGKGVFTTSNIIIGVAMVVILAGVVYFAWPNRTHDGAIDEGASLNGETTLSEVDGDKASTGEAGATGSAAAGTVAPKNTVKVAVLADPDLFDFTNEKIRGCDAVVMIEKEIAPTKGVLNAALTTLFTDTFNHGFTPGNFIPTQKDLKFERVTIDAGVANVYLTGKVGPIAGVCDVPRIETQITETALQFSTVSAVKIMLNGEPLVVE
jgi:hypothetical protein